MEKFWKAALGTAGVGAIAFFVFYSLYKEWLTLPIFPKLTQVQAYNLMRMFLVFTFVALIGGLIAWVASRENNVSGDEALYRLETIWKGVNYIDCENLIGPDVAKASDALLMTSTYWRKKFIDRKLLFEHHGHNFIELFEQINSCDKLVPGYLKPKKLCKDFLPAIVRSTYKEIKTYATTTTVTSRRSEDQS